jgi:ubiquinone/menaquinone biosynthesis C-methylase UbiE
MGGGSEQGVSPEDERLRAEVLRRAAPRPGDFCVDLGAADGFLTFPLAEQVGLVVAVHPAPALLAEPPATRAVIHRRTSELMSLVLRRESVDLVVSAYALHRLHYADKREIVARAKRWLRPGGRIAVGDLMFDLRFKSGRKFLRYGFAFGGGRPAEPQFWTEALRDAGFKDVGYMEIAAETGVVWGHV